MNTQSISFPSAVLWDFDGVLADTSELHYEAWRRALAERGMKLTKEKFLTLFGKSPKATIFGLLGSEYEPSTAAKIRQQKEKYYRQLIHGKVQMTPGVRIWLKRFSLLCVQAIASSAPNEDIEILLDDLQLRSFFQEIVSSDNLPSKPDPTIFLTAASKLKVPPNKCLVIEDSPSGVEAALRAGIKVFAICTSYSPEVLADADLVIPDLTSLTEAQINRCFSNCLHESIH